MTLLQAYRQHAERILYDGMRHDANAIYWAHWVLGTETYMATARLAIAERAGRGLSPAEARLGCRLSPDEVRLASNRQGVL
jgi:hypothetical protein